MNFSPYFLVLTVINIIAFILYGVDKYKAINKKRRISEATLLTAAFLMGSYGAAFGMIIFNHKTKKLKFRLLVPFAVLLNTAIFILGRYLYV
ncbi:MAG: DUF1294 domain-containing protein [Bacillota bacterium]|nr:DUF1294 domain-containing protein [Bacillota bacterium]